MLNRILSYAGQDIGLRQTGHQITKYLQSGCKVVKLVAE